MRNRLMVAAIVGAVMSGASIWVLAGAVDLSTLGGLLGGAELALVGAAIGTLALSMIVRTARWWTILPATTSRRATVPNLLPLVLVGYAINSLAPMRLGDIVRGLAASRRFRMGGPETLGSVALERILDAGALAAVAALASIGSGLAPSWLTQGSIVIAVAAITILGTVYLLGITARRRSAAGSVNAGSMFWRAWIGLRANPRAIAVSSALSAIAWYIDGITVLIIARALGIEFGWEVAMLIATGAALGAILPSAPAAIGTFHLAGTAVGVAMGLSTSTALAVVVLWHAATIVPLVVAGAISTPIVGIGLRDLRAATIRNATRSTGSGRPLPGVYP